MSNESGGTTIGDLLGLLEVYPRDAVVCFGEGGLLRFMGLKLKGPRRVQVELAESGAVERRAPEAPRGPQPRRDPPKATGPTAAPGPSLSPSPASVLAPVDEAAVARKRRVNAAVREWLILTHASAAPVRGDLVAQLALKFDVSEAEVRESIPKGWRTAPSPAPSASASRPSNSGRD